MSRLQLTHILNTRRTAIIVFLDIIHRPVFVLNKRERWIRSRNALIALIYHPHKLLDLILLEQTFQCFGADS
jgi:hypothetical protein